MSRACNFDELGTPGRLLNCDGSSGDVYLEDKVAGVFQEAFELWKERHRKYGAGNIGATGALGCFVRSNDKLARLREVYIKGNRKDFGDDSLQDAWLDLINYANMGLLCERNQWPS